MEQQDDQNMWNAIYSFFFVTACAFLLLILYRTNGSLPTEIALFDLILLILATFRLTRLFVYDKITRFVRDFFMKREEVYSEEGSTYFIKKQHGTGPMQTAYDLLTCPWCFAVWASVCVTFFYFLTPLAWLPILFLAIAGVASLLQLTANLIGWSAENGKIRAEKERSSR